MTELSWFKRTIPTNSNPPCSTGPSWYIEDSKIVGMKLTRPCDKRDDSGKKVAQRHLSMWNATRKVEVNVMNDTGLHPPISAAPFWHYSFFDLSVPDIIVVSLMVIVFILAILLPFPGGKHDDSE